MLRAPYVSSSYDRACELLELHHGSLPAAMVLTQDAAGTKALHHDQVWSLQQSSPKINECRGEHLSSILLHWTCFSKSPVALLPPVHADLPEQKSCTGKLCLITIILPLSRPDGTPAERAVAS